MQESCENYLYNRATKEKLKFAEFFSLYNKKLLKVIGISLKKVDLFCHQPWNLPDFFFFVFQFFTTKSKMDDKILWRTLELKPLCGFV